jgi:hypothetical protein
VNPHSYAHLIFDKGAKNIQWRKKSSSISTTGKTGYLPAENWNWIHVCHPVHLSTQSDEGP